MAIDKIHTPIDDKLTMRVNSNWKNGMRETAAKKRYGMTEYVIKAVDEKMEREE